MGSSASEKVWVVVLQIDVRKLMGEMLSLCSIELIDHVYKELR